MKVKKPKLLKKLTSKIPSRKSQEIQKIQDDAASEFYRIQKQPEGNGGEMSSPAPSSPSAGFRDGSFGDAEISGRASGEGDLTFDGEDGWDSEGLSSGETGTSADLVKCLNNLRIRSMSKGQASPSQLSQTSFVPRLAPPPPSVSSRDSLDPKSSVDTGIPLTWSGSLKPRLSTTSALSSQATEVEVLHVEARSGGSLHSTGQSKEEMAKAASVSEKSEEKSEQSVNPYNFDGVDVEVNSLNSNKSVKSVRSNASESLSTSQAHPDLVESDPDDHENGAETHEEQSQEADSHESLKKRRQALSGHEVAFKSAADWTTFEDNADRNEPTTRPKHTHKPSEMSDAFYSATSEKAPSSEQGSVHSIEEAGSSVSQGGGLGEGVEDAISERRKRSHSIKTLNLGAVHNAQAQPSPVDMPARSASLPLPNNWIPFNLDDDIKGHRKGASKAGPNLNPWAEFDEEMEEKSEKSEKDGTGTEEKSEGSVRVEPKGNAQLEFTPRAWDEHVAVVEKPATPALNPFAEETESEDQDTQVDALEVHPSRELEEGTFLRDVVLDEAIQHTGLPHLQLVETVNAVFSGDRQTRYSVRGEVKMKLSGPHVGKWDGEEDLERLDFDAFDPYRLGVRLKCVSQNVYLKEILANQKLLDEPEMKVGQMTPTKGGHARKNSLSMNEARQGIVESRVLHWNLMKAVGDAWRQQDGSHDVTLLRYRVRPTRSCSAPLHVQVRWRRPHKAGQNLLVNVTLSARSNLSTPLWGVTVTLKGLENLVVEENGRPQGMSVPKAEWNATDKAFQWRIPVVYPDDPPRPFSLAVLGNQISASNTMHVTLSGSVNFIMPHTTLSGTVLEGWIEKQPCESMDEALEEVIGDGEVSPFVYRHIPADKMCISGEYLADINYA